MAYSCVEWDIKPVLINQAVNLLYSRNIKDVQMSVCPGLFGSGHGISCQFY